MGRGNKESFYVHTDRHEEWNGHRRWLKIVVYDDLAHMHSDVKEYNRNSHEDMDPNGIGVYQPPWYRLRVVPDRPVIHIYPKYYGGLIRMWRDKLSQEVVNHEAVHAAAAIWRMDVGAKVDLGTDCEWDEEGFAYLVGDLSAAITQVLVRNDIDVFVWNQ